MAFLLQLKILLWKNLTLKRRTPVILVFLVVQMRVEVECVNVNGDCLCVFVSMVMSFNPDKVICSLEFYIQTSPF